MTIYRHNIGVEIDYNGIGKRIKIRRNQLGYSQEQLAFECNLSVPYISQIENGRKSVSLNALLQVADVMDCTLDWLVFGDSFLCSDFKRDEISIPVDNCTDEEKQYLRDLLNMNIRMMRSYRNNQKDPNTKPVNISEA